MRAIGRDLRDGIRVLRKNAGFAAAVVSILALGIGANAAIFSIADAALWKPLPYAAPDRLVALPAAHRGGDMGAEVAFANFLDWRRESRSFERLGAWAPLSVNAGAAEGAGPASAAAAPERLSAAAISPGGLAAMGVTPILGRLFSESEEAPNARVAVLSYGLWQSRFGGAPDVVGRTIRLGDEPHSIVGVMPPEFSFPDPGVRLWLPLRITPGRAADRQGRWVYVFGRLSAGVSAAAAQSDVDAVMGNLEKRYPETNSGWGARVVPLSDRVAGSSRPVVWILFATVALVLAVACANVANLQLARASTRRKEMAIRAALGASARDIVRQLLVEGAILAAAGAALGILIARAALPLLARLAAGTLPRVEEARLDGRVLLFALAVSAAAGILFGLVPARAALRADLADALQGSRGGSPGPGANRFRRLLTAAQIAAALVLTVGASLLSVSLRRLGAVSPGLEARHVLTVETVLSSSRYPDDERRSAFFRALVAKASRIPGVESAAGVANLPLSGANATEGYAVDGQAPADPRDVPEAGLRVVTPGYFRTLSIPILRGRDFTASDRADAPGVVLVNRTFAHRHWPGQDPLGRRVRIDGGKGRPHEVVGVVGDVRHDRLDAPAVPEIYVSYDQHPYDAMVLLARSRLALSDLASRLRAEAASIDPQQPLFHAATMETVLSGSLSRPRLFTGLLGSFAGLALLLAVLGVASVVSYSVAQRLPELAIRAAMGATPGDLRRFVLRDTALFVAAGLGAGLAGAFAAARSLRGLLYGVGPNDPAVFALAAAVLAAAALAATLGPAFRASRVDLVIALRG